MRNIGILHPGAMGTAAAISAGNGGSAVHWCSAGRREQSRKRAEAAGLIDAGTLAELCRLCPAIVSVCPPEFAESVCDDVLRLGFRGLYIDANAISPRRKCGMAAKMSGEGARFVDGGIIGMPPKKKGESWLILSGPDAEEAASYFHAGPLEPEVIGGAVGRASALKMCFAGFAKGSTALMATMLAAAGHYGVEDELKRNWERRGRSIAAIEGEIQRAAQKAWRFTPEMHEIAAALEEAGLPRAFHLAAADVYERLARFKDAEAPGLNEITEALRRMDSAR